MAQVSEREHRQFALMRRRVQDLRDGQPIGHVIADLDALVWQLEETPEPWRRRYIDAWGQLEVVYALALEAGDATMPTASDPLVAAALDNIDALLDEVGE
jgi:hypothetical protein